ncbi:MAG: hypothetical protein IH851_03350 [Armatimonadetes bacterium]|nr:hypothetical protein [Armatimonadota bacterium]
MKPIAVIAVAFAASFALPQSSPNRANEIYDEYEARLDRRIDGLYHSGEYDAIIDVYRVLVGIRPHDAETHGGLAYALGNVERHADAFQELVRFRRGHPDDPAAAFNEAQDYHKWARNRDTELFNNEETQGQVSKLWARIPALLEPVIERSATAGNYSLLARAYEKMGLFRESLRIWEMRRERRPGDPAVQQGIERLKRKLTGGYTDDAKEGDDEKTDNYSA